MAHFCLSFFFLLKACEVGRIRNIAAFFLQTINRGGFCLSLGRKIVCGNKNIYEASDMQMEPTYKISSFYDFLWPTKFLQTDGQKYRQTDRRTDRQTDGRTDISTKPARAMPSPCAAFSILNLEWSNMLFLSFSLWLSRALCCYEMSLGIKLLGK